MTPHPNEGRRIKSAKEQLKQNKKVGILLSNACTIEIIDNKYRILKSSNDAFSKVVYWKDEGYIIKDLEVCDEFMNMNEITK